MKLTPWIRSATLGVLSAGALITAGCSLPLPQAQSDPTKFFVLSMPASTTTVEINASAPAVRLRPIEVASYLRGRAMIVRRGENELEFREFARWGEPLDQGIARLLREGLLAKGAASSVDSGSFRSADASEVKYEVSVRVLNCEGRTDGSVSFRAVWDVTSFVPNGPAVHGSYHPTDLKWSPRNDASLATALSRAVDGLAGDIAAGLAKAR